MRLSLMISQKWWFYFIIFFSGCLSLMAQAIGVLFGVNILLLLSPFGFIFGLFHRNLLGAPYSIFIFCLGYFSPLLVKMLFNSALRTKEYLTTLPTAFIATASFFGASLLLGYALRFLLQKIFTNRAHLFKGRTSFKG